MSNNNSQNAFGLVAILSLAVFVVAFALFAFMAKFGIIASIFMAFVIALVVAIILFIAFGNPASQTEPLSGAQNSGSSGANASTVAAPVAASAAADTAANEAAAKKAAEEAAAAEKAASEKAAADKAAAESAAAEKAAAEKAAAAEADRRSAEEEAARQKAEAEAAAAAEAEAARKAAEASSSASGIMPPAGDAENTPDYDGDGVREGTNEGTRPAGLSEPRGGKADDLKQIKGIGPKLEKLCNTLGFWHFDQVAAWTSDEVAWVDANLEGFKGRVTRDKWVEQAGVLASGGETEFSKRVEDGDVY